MRQWLQRKAYEAMAAYTRKLQLHPVSSIAEAPTPFPAPTAIGRSSPSGFKLLALNNLRDNKGATKEKRRLGRGIGSGRGKTCGRGHKGQKARSNRPRLGFEGGQTPLRIRLPRRGFHNPFSLTFKPVNLKSVAESVEQGVLDSGDLITMKTLKDVGLVGKQMKDGVKLLGAGADKFSLPLHFEVSRVSKKAKAAVEAAGGSVTRVHYTKLGLKALTKPEWFAKKGRLLPRPAQPAPKMARQVDEVGRLPAPTSRPQPVASSNLEQE
ncbi:hypothetical protein GOP47_0003875 [Adiantum capillus-veneris]|uniref:Large ribosomal subunit protein uL15/eL18 domain-containing protein n=1 Tax=Adiantum capillus-veneris TaxID=13818 RepID=A0A9D4V7I2_ADICA|nr:hypothetical protein GOP47_0003874 [Adiantum capillus-veneris]KAI5080692.1 hypothetical protein GOP47_0003875 [Adiantum capillus-veneris]